MSRQFDVIVVGGGHAGVEAAMATAHLGLQTLLLTINRSMISNMPCNPSIGGSAKGIVVREIDALGGMMGKIADQTYLQMKMLNTGKGPGVQCLRSQADKLRYPKAMQETVSKTKNLTVEEGMVHALLHDDHHVFGVELATDRIQAKAVILTTGTYMESQVLIGHSATSAGPDGEAPSLGLSPFLKTMGIDVIRLKTGTPQRIDRDSIDFSKLEVQYGSQEPCAFSYETKTFLPFEEQVPCHLTYTTPETHAIIRAHLKESAMYGGLVTGVGPRYCPSIEDKIVRFADKERHQLFVEPESFDTKSMYLQGFSTSMPIDVQDKMVHSLPGFQQAKILKYAYAIEYDAIYPTQFDRTLQVKRWPGLYCAGQICGTSGYEEAASLGLMAGINAARKILNQPPFILKRDEAYIGVMIDDLVTKGTLEPYRLLSSRAEYRLLLRHDNADRRLTEYGFQIGLISKTRYEAFQQKEQALLQAREILEGVYFGENENLQAYASQVGAGEIKPGTSAISALRRPNITLKGLQPFLPMMASLQDTLTRTQLEIMIKYEGYIAKEMKDAERMRKMEAMELDATLDYVSMDGLALEARQKLQEVRPDTIGQASRIAGVNPSDIAVLLLHLKKGGRHDN